MYIDKPILGTIALSTMLPDSNRISITSLVETASYVRAMNQRCGVKERPQLDCACFNEPDCTQPVVQ